MRKIRLVAFIMSAAMLVAAIFAKEARPTIFLAKKLAPIKLQSDIPEKFADWASQPDISVAVVNPETRQLLDSLYTQLLTRVYSDSRGNRVMLSVAYGDNQSDDRSLHYPEVCYPAQGFKLLKNKERMLNLGGRRVKVKELVAVHSERVEPITYWTTVGEKTAIGAVEHKLGQLSYGFNGLIPDGMIVRVSSLGGDEDAQWAMQNKFLSDMISAIRADMVSRYVGVLSLN